MVNKKRQGLIVVLWASAMTCCPAWFGACSAGYYLVFDRFARWMDGMDWVVG
jgi:hypothetical protein